MRLREAYISSSIEDQVCFCAGVSACLLLSASLRRCRSSALFSQAGVVHAVPRISTARMASRLGHGRKCQQVGRASATQRGSNAATCAPHIGKWLRLASSPSLLLRFLSSFSQTCSLFSTSCSSCCYLTWVVSSVCLPSLETDSCPQRAPPPHHIGNGGFIQGMNHGGFRARLSVRSGRRRMYPPLQKGRPL